MTLDSARLMREMQAHTDLLAAQLASSTIDRQVPTCPDWTLRDLAVHVGGVQRWVTLIIAGCLTAPPQADPGRSAPAAPDDLAAWVREGATALAAAAGGVDPQTSVWSWSGDDRVAFWVRRMAHEAEIHAVDAQLVSGPPRPLSPDLAADGIDEWLWMLTLPPAAAKSATYPVREGGESLHLHATDPELTAGAGEWTARRTPSGMTSERGHVKADVAVRGTASELFLLLLRRRFLDQASVEVLGDRTLLEEWLDRVRFE